VTVWPAADLAGVDPIVAELFVGDVAVLVAQQPIAAHGLRVPLDLRLGLLRHGLQRAREVLDEDAARLFQVVDVGVGAVALVGEAFHQARRCSCPMPKPDVESWMPRAASSPIRARMVSGPVAPTLATPSEHNSRRLIASGRKAERATSKPRRSPASAFVEPSLCSRAMASAIAAVVGGRRQHQTRLGAEDHQADAIVLAQLLEQQAERLLHHPKRFSMSIEPETSITKVSTAGLRCAGAIDRAVTAKRTSR
jgi:hypothetical protein